MDVDEAFDKFSTVLSEDEIKELARKYGVEDERERKLGAVQKSSDSQTFYHSISSLSSYWSWQNYSMWISYQIFTTICTPLIQNYTKVIKTPHLEETNK
ncbi:MAG: hypothetical protein C4B59_10060 [Candidatus Methanogaster sp.]|uniref:Uncharacterized protein n=1 Tax=Candidatus Methanogaster sp. TaxID=3386292 RepID=A0AC61L1Z2_9EURY|nr:MAG: hypothetical protein C4B59_10060 [ANME-2 cluster archaeon]